MNSTEEEKLTIKSQLNELESKLGFIDDELDTNQSQNDELLRIKIESSKMNLNFLNEDIPSIKKQNNIKVLE